MTPIHELLNRIRWDPEFAKGDWQVGYFDRVEQRVILVPFRAVLFPEDAPQVFQIIGSDGLIHRVPFHRVREVYKDAQRVWHRPEGEESPKSAGRRPKEIRTPKGKGSRQGRTRGLNPTRF